MSRYDSRVSRLFSIITEVKANQTQSLAELLTRLNISRSQFYKDRKLLAEMGFCFRRKKGGFAIEQDVSLPIKDFTLSERLALIMALRQLSASGESYLSFHGLEAARKLISSLDATWREATGVLFDDFVLKQGFGCEPVILNGLQKACQENRRVKISYQKPKAWSMQQYEFDPYFVYFQNRSMYVDGYCSTRLDFRTFKVARIQSIIETPIRFQRKKDFDFKYRHRGTFTAYSGSPEKEVVIRFSPKVKLYIQETLWHHTQQIKSLENGFIEFRVSVAEPREVMWWAFQWGDGAEVMEPEWLRKEAKDSVRRMELLYAD